MRNTGQADEHAATWCNPPASRFSLTQCCLIRPDAGSDNQIRTFRHAETPQQKPIQRKSSGAAEHHGKERCHVEKVSLITRLPEMRAARIHGLQLYGTEPI